MIGKSKRLKNSKIKPFRALKLSNKRMTKVPKIISPEMKDNLFWKLTFVFKDKYPLFWFLIGTIYLILREFLLTANNARHYHWTELFFSYFGLAGLPTLIIYGNKLLIKLRDYFSKELTLKNGSFYSWFSVEIYRIFDLRNYFSLFIALLVNLLATTTIILASLPFDFNVIHIFSILSLQPIFFFCGWAAYFVVAIMILLYRIVRLEFSIPFLEYYPRVISRMSQSMYLVTLFVLVEYLGLFFAIAFGPWSISLYMLPWIVGLAIYPILSLLWGIFQIHKLNLEIKQQHLDFLKSETQTILISNKSNDNAKTIESLKNITEIYFKIKQSKDRSISYEAIITLILTLASATGQIFIAISQVVHK